jgi:hypothetical protein
VAQRAAAQLAGLPERYSLEAEAGLRHHWADLSVPQMWQLCEAVGLHPTTMSSACDALGARCACGRLFQGP